MYLFIDCVLYLMLFWCRLIVSEFMVIVVYVLLGWRYLDMMIVCNNFCHWNHFPILILTVHVNFPNGDLTFFKYDLKMTLDFFSEILF